MTGDAGLLPVPFRQLRTELIPKGSELPQAFVNNSGEMLVSEREHLGTWRFARTRKLEDLGYLLELRLRDLEVIEPGFTPR